MATKHLLNLVQQPLGDRLRTLPILTVYLTDGCNSRCVTCDIWRNPRRNMSAELVEQIAAELRPLAVRWVVLSGGEAMQHPQWAQIARRFRAEGVRVILLTNGLLLRKQVDDVIASVDEAVVSLDAGTAATYEAIRGVDGFDLILDGIAQVRAGGIRVTTRTTVQRANYREIPDVIAAAKAVGVNHVSFLTVDVSNPFAFGDRDLAVNTDTSAALTGADLPELASILDDVERRFADDFASGLIAESPAKLRRMVDYFAALIGEGAFPEVRCNAPHISTVIEVDGSLRPCFFLPRTGSLRDQPMGVAINQQTALDLRRAYRTGRRDECARCVCPLYKGVRSLREM